MRSNAGQTTGFEAFGVMSLLMSSAWLSSSVVSQANVPAGMIMLGVTLTGIFKPNVLLGLLFFSIPFVGVNFPGTPQNILFFQGLSAAVFGLSIRWLWGHQRGLQVPRLRLDDPQTLSVALFSLCAGLSLLSLPADEFGFRLTQLPSPKSLGLLGVRELWAIYPLLRVLLVGLGFFLFVIISDFPSSWRPSPRGWLISSLMALVITLLLGLLDYTGLLSLESIRKVYTGVDPSGRPLRLQSILGHPAWCAIYINLAIPAILVLFTVKMTVWLRVGLVLLLLILGEVVLILTFSRGGWLSYPLTLLLVWTSIHAAQGWRSSETSSKRRSASWLKVLLSLPLTILVSISLSQLLNHVSLDRYTERFKAIAHTSDRTAYIEPSLQLFARHPLLGGGMDSFSYRYAQEFIVPTGSYFSAGNPLSNTYNNAHNTYLQILTGTGALGFLAFLFMAYAFIRPVVHSRWKVLAGGKEDVSDSFEDPTPIFSMIAGSTMAAACIYGIFDDVLYPPAFMLLLLMVLGVGSPPNEKGEVVSRKVTARLFGGIILVVLAHLIWEYGVPGITRKLQAESRHVGCYPEEKAGLAGHQRVAWCSDQFELETPIEWLSGKPYGFIQVLAGPKAKPQEPIHLRAFRGGELLTTMQLKAETPTWLVIPLEGKVKDESFLTLRFEADHATVPLLDPQAQSLDRRRLSILRLKDQSFPWSPGATPLDAACNERAEIPEPLRWCSRGGRIDPLSTMAPETLAMRLGEIGATAAHPVWVFLWNDQGLHRMHALSDANWHTLAELGLEGPALGLHIGVSRPTFRRKGPNHFESVAFGLKSLK